MNALVIKLTGSVQESNLEEFKEKSLAVIKGINTELVTDDDFDEAKKAIKVCDTSINAIKSARENALHGTIEISNLFNALDSLESELKATKKSLNDQVKAETKRRKSEIIEAAMRRVQTEIDNYAKDYPVVSPYSFTRAQFEDGGKHKRTIESYKDGVESVADYHIETLASHVEDIAKRTKILAPYKDEYPAIFHDEENLLLKETETLKATIESRVNAFKLQESEKKRAEEKAIAEAESKAVEEPEKNDTDYVEQHGSYSSENEKPAGGTIDNAVEGISKSKSTLTEACEAIMRITMSDSLTREIINAIQDGNIPGVRWVG